MTNDITLDFYDADREIVPQHYGPFSWDVAGEVRRHSGAPSGQRALPYWADPFPTIGRVEINTDDGGRGVLL